jgi:hypothetical protein
MLSAPQRAWILTMSRTCPFPDEFHDMLEKLGFYPDGQNRCKRARLSKKNLRRARLKLNRNQKFARCDWWAQYWLRSFPAPADGPSLGMPPHRCLSVPLPHRVPPWPSMPGRAPSRPSRLCAPPVSCAPNFLPRAPHAEPAACFLPALWKREILRQAVAWQGGIDVEPPPLPRICPSPATFRESQHGCNKRPGGTAPGTFRRDGCRKPCLRHAQLDPGHQKGVLMSSTAFSKPPAFTSNASILSSQTQSS